MRRPRSLALLATLLVLAAAVAGCSGSSSSDTDAAASDTGAPTQPVDTDATTGFRLTSTDFTDGGKLQVDQTCQGKGTRPTLAWSGVPAGTKSLTLVVFDPDAGTDGFVHWVVGGLDPAAGKLEPGALPSGAVEANNGAGKPGWQPACPPSGNHHYEFTLYALDGPTTITEGEDPKVAISDTKAATIASTTLTGRYQKR